MSKNEYFSGRAAEVGVLAPVLGAARTSGFRAIWARGVLIEYDFGGFNPHVYLLQLLDKSIFMYTLSILSKYF